MKVVEKTQTLKMFVGGRWVDSESGRHFDAFTSIFIGISS